MKDIGLYCSHQEDEQGSDDELRPVITMDGQRIHSISRKILSTPCLYQKFMSGSSRSRRLVLLLDEDDDDYDIVNCHFVFKKDEFV